MTEPDKKLYVGIFESDSYRIAKENIGDSRLLEDIESQFGLPLAQNPYFGERVPLTKGLYIFKTQAFYPRVPSFRILYQYLPDNDPYNIVLLSIDIADNSPYDENNH